MDQELTPKEIVERDFSTSMRGYSPSEVDEFLDIIIRDYDNFISEINTLREKNHELENQVNELKKTRHEPIEKPVQKPSQQVTAPTSEATNFDILKRLSNLERHVFGSKLNENK